MKKMIKNFVSRYSGVLKPVLEKIFAFEARLAEKWSKAAHRRLYFAQWNLPPTPEHFDHHIDMNYQWPATGNALWLERGVYGLLAIKRGGSVLELACGDGFNARFFYSYVVKNVVACDFDPSAIRTARTKNHAHNINFVLADIRTDMPEGRFDNVVWDAAIEHFTTDEIRKIMTDIKRRLTPTGVLSGYTLISRNDGQKHLQQHEYEFKDKEDLMSFFRPHFRNVTVFETVYPEKRNSRNEVICPERHNLYFWASDGIVPFHAGWKDFITQG